MLDADPFEPILDQDKAIAFLRSGFNSSRIPHALAFVGPKGIGKGLTAERFAAWVLAGGDQSQGSGWQEELGLLNQGAHPDFKSLSPDSSMASPVIKVESARALVAFMQQTPSRSQSRVAIVQDAEKMNAQAANGILKV